MSLNDFTDYKWGVFTADAGAAQMAGFGAFDTRQQSSFQSDAAFVVLWPDPGLYNSNLGTAGSWNGGETIYGGFASDGLTNFETSIGTLHLTVKGGVSPTGYFKIPDTGSTATLLGVGVAALAFARRRLGY